MQGKVAKDLHVSLITTQRAYDDLGKDGFIQTVPAKGTFVSAAFDLDTCYKEEKQTV